MVINPLSSALAAMSANAAKMAVAANNIANSNTVGFKKSTAVVESDAAGLPVVSIIQSSLSGPIIISPDGLPGNEQFRELPNMSLADEFIQIQLAEIGYKVGASLVSAQNEMVGTILDLLV